MHKAHVRDTRAWVQETAGRDWVLLGSEWSETIETWVYFWKGPPGTNTRFTCYGTDHSSLFLGTLRTALESFRHSFAQHVSELPRFAMDNTV